MWFALQQRMLNWMSGDRRSAKGVCPDELRISEPVLTGHQPLHMEHVGNANVQVGQNNGSVRVVHLKQERNVTHIHVYGDTDTRQESEVEFPLESRYRGTPEQRELIRIIMKMTKPMEVYEFMKSTYGTQFVLDLDHTQMLDVRRRVDEINKRIHEQREGVAL